MTIFNGKKLANLLSGFLFLYAVIFLLLRFIHLDADFPEWLTQSGSIFTDEGWYANAAVRYFISGNWYLPGDFNPVTNMPVSQIIFHYSFSMFDLSLSVGRSTTALIFIFLSVLSSMLLYKKYGPLPAILCLTLMATTFTGFAFSRIMITGLIATFFVISAIYIIRPIEANISHTRIFFSSLFIGVGMLTKTTMVFAVPVLFYLSWWHAKDNREFIKYFLLSLFVLVIVVGGFNLYSKQIYLDDYIYFSQLNFAARQHHGFVDWILNIPKVIVGLKAFGYYFIVINVLMIFSGFFVSRRFRKDPFVHVFLMYIILYMGLLSLVAYNPPRYYLPLLVPIILLSVISVFEIKIWIKDSIKPVSQKIIVLPMLLIFSVSLIESFKVVNYLTNLNYSYINMIRETKEIIESRGSDLTSVLLFGANADTVSIETGIPAANSIIRVDSVKNGLKTLKPDYVLIDTDSDLASLVISGGGEILELKSWDVFGRHHVLLAHVDWKN